jgi:hypothetical protein
MSSHLALAIAAIVLLGLPSGAHAQRNAVDRADRGQRLDSDALRNDFLQDQLKKPALPSYQQAAPAPQDSDKPKSKKR